MEIREIAVSHYGPLRDVKYRPQPGLQVFYGPNESGKTLLLDAILKLMLGNRLRDFAGLDRVPDLPQGRIVLVSHGSEYILDGNTRLDQITRLDSNHLRNVFVIRNKDLHIAGQANYLRRVSDQLTGMEGQRLEDLRKILSRRNCLTNPSSAARLSKSIEFNKIGEHVETAENLGAEIQEYLEFARSEQLDSLERRLEEARRQLDSLKNRIKEQEQAEKRQKYSTLSQLVSDYENRAEAARHLQPYTKTVFMKLQDLESRALAARETAQENQRHLAQLQPRLEGATGNLVDSMAELTPLENRKPKLEHLEQQALVAAAHPFLPTPGKYKGFSFALLGLAALGTFFAFLGELPPLLWLTPALAVAGALILFWADRNARTKALECRRRDRSLLQQGAAAGIMAETLQQLAAAVAKEKTSLEQARSRQQHLASVVREMEQKQLHLEENIRAYNVLARDLEQQLRQELQRLEIENLDEFGNLLEQYNWAQAQCDELHQRLEDEFGQVPPHTGEWRALLKQIPIPPDPGILFAPDSLTELREAKELALAQIEEIQEGLQRHGSMLNSFAAAVQALPLEQEIGCSLPNRFANLEILDYVGLVLDQFVTTVNTRFTVACKALAILEALEREEQEKMADLVAADKPVQDIFRQITAGRYTNIILDSDLDIRVQNREGLELPASALSQGTYDQLYLALRLSLAQDLLPGETGFLLLDDAFLCADSVRMEKMLAVLEGLAAQGWQILYFTMDERLAQAAPRHTNNEILTLNPLAG